MISQVKLLRNIIVARGTIDKQELSQFIDPQYQQYTDKITKVIFQQKNLIFNNDQITITKEERTKYLSLETFFCKSQFLEDIFYLISSSLYQGFDQSLIIKFINLDQKQISRAVLILKQSNLLIQTKKHILFPTYLVKGIPEHVLELSNELSINNTHYSMMQFNQVFKEFQELAIEQIHLKTSQQQIEKVVHKIKNFNKQWNQFKFFDYLVNYGILQIKDIGQQNYFIVPDNTTQLIQSKNSPFYPIYSLANEIQYTLFDRLFMSINQGLNNLSKICLNYFTHSNFKQAEKLKEFLTTFYPLSVNKGHVVEVLQNSDQSDFQKSVVFYNLNTSNPVQDEPKSHADNILMYKQKDFRLDYCMQIVNSVEFISVFQLLNILNIKLNYEGDLIKLDRKVSQQLLKELGDKVKILTIDDQKYIFSSASKIDETHINKKLNKTPEKQQSDLFIKKRIDRYIYLITTINGLQFQQKHKNIYKNNSFYQESLLAYLTPRNLLHIDSGLSFIIQENLSKFTQREYFDTPLMELPIELICTILYDHYAYKVSRQQLSLDISEIVQLGLLKVVSFQDSINNALYQQMTNLQKQKTAIQLSTEVEIDVSVLIDEKDIQIVENFTFLTKDGNKFLLHFIMDISNIYIVLSQLQCFYTVINSLGKKPLSLAEKEILLYKFDISQNIIIDTQYDQILKTLEQFCKNAPKATIEQLKHVKSILRATKSHPILNVENLTDELKPDEIIACLIKIQQKTPIKQIITYDSKRLFPFTINQFSATFDMTYRKPEKKPKLRKHLFSQIRSMQLGEQRIYRIFAINSRYNTANSTKYFYEQTSQFSCPKVTQTAAKTLKSENLLSKEKFTKIITAKQPITLALHPQNIAGAMDEFKQVTQKAHGTPIDLRGDKTLSKQVKTEYLAVIHAYQAQQTLPTPLPDTFPPPFLTPFLNFNSLFTPKTLKIAGLLRKSQKLPNFTINLLEKSSNQLTIIQDLSLIRNVVYIDQTIETNVNLNSGNFMLEIEAEIAHFDDFPVADIKVPKFSEIGLKRAENDVQSVMMTSQMVSASQYDDFAEVSQFSGKVSLGQFLNDFDEVQAVQEVQRVHEVDFGVFCDAQRVIRGEIEISDAVMRSGLLQLDSDANELVFVQRGTEYDFLDLDSQNERKIRLSVMDFVYQYPGVSIQKILARFQSVIPSVVVRFLNVLIYDDLVDVRCNRGFSVSFLTGKVNELVYTVSTDYEKLRNICELENVDIDQGNEQSSDQGEVQQQEEAEVKEEEHE